MAHAERTDQEKGQIRVLAALTLAMKAHDGQVDKAGMPYILHPLRVMLQMDTDVERALALVHDVREDHPEYTAEAEAQLGPEIWSALDALTRGEEELYEAYIERVKEFGEIAVKVKLADLRDNMDINRLNGEMTTKDAERLKRYVAAFRVLSSWISCDWQGYKDLMMLRNVEHLIKQ